MKIHVIRTHSNEHLFSYNGLIPPIGAKIIRSVDDRERALVVQNVEILVPESDVGNVQTDVYLHVFPA